MSHIKVRALHLLDIACLHMCIHCLHLSLLIEEADDKKSMLTDGGVLTIHRILFACVRACNPLNAPVHECFRVFFDA